MGEHERRPRKGHFSVAPLDLHKVKIPRLPPVPKHDRVFTDPFETADPEAPSIQRSHWVPGPRYRRLYIKVYNE